MLKKKKKKKCSQNWYNIIAIVDVCRPNHSFKGVINDCNFLCENQLGAKWLRASSYHATTVRRVFFIVLSNWKTKKKSSLVDDVQGVIIFGQSSQMSGGVQWVEMVFCYQNCSDILREKIVLVIQKYFWNSRLKAKNSKKFWDN